MDPQTLGWIGGIAGGVIGLLGAGVGVYASLASAKSSAERRFVLFGSAVLCLLIGAQLAALFLIPQPWNALSWLVYAPLLMFTIRWFNRQQAKLNGAGQTGEPGRS